MTEKQQPAERREYFRIKNWLILNHESIETLDEVPDIDELSSSESPRISLLHELSRLENENEAYLGSLTDKQSQLGNYLLNLNKKMELLTRFVVQSLDSDQNELTEVDISGGGLRFTSNQAYPIDQLMKIELLLVPECTGISAYARVVDCKTKSAQQHEVALIFIKLRESDRDAIIKHVFKIQSKQLREDKQNPSEN